VTVWTFLTAIVASATALWIAYKVYPWQKKLDRDLQIEGELVSVMEELTIKVNGSHAVGITKVPYFTDEIAAIDAAIGVVRVYDLGDLSQAAYEYKKSVKEWRSKILSAKGKRSKGFKYGTKRPPEYADAMSKVDDQFERVKSFRATFFGAATSVFGIKDENLALVMVSADEIEQTEIVK
jgi:hypothetical protein